MWGSEVSIELIATRIIDFSSPSRKIQKLGSVEAIGEWLGSFPILGVMSRTGIIMGPLRGD